LRILLLSSVVGLISADTAKEFTAPASLQTGIEISQNPTTVFEQNIPKLAQILKKQLEDFANFAEQSGHIEFAKKCKEIDTTLYFESLFKKYKNYPEILEYTLNLPIPGFDLLDESLKDLVYGLAMPKINNIYINSDCPDPQGTVFHELNHIFLQKNPYGYVCTEGMVEHNAATWNKEFDNSYLKETYRAFKAEIVSPEHFIRYCFDQKNKEIFEDTNMTHLFMQAADQLPSMWNDMQQQELLDRLENLEPNIHNAKHTIIFLSDLSRYHKLESEQVLRIVDKQIQSFILDLPLGFTMAFINKNADYFKKYTDPLSKEDLKKMREINERIHNIKSLTGFLDFLIDFLIFYRILDTPIVPIYILLTYILSEMGLSWLKNKHKEKLENIINELKSNKITSQTFNLLMNGEQIKGLNLSHDLSIIPFYALHGVKNEEDFINIIKGRISRLFLGKASKQADKFIFNENPEQFKIPVATKVGEQFTHYFQTNDGIFVLVSSENEYVITPGPFYMGTIPKKYFNRENYTCTIIYENHDKYFKFSDGKQFSIKGISMKEYNKYNDQLNANDNEQSYEFKKQIYNIMIFHKTFRSYINKNNTKKRDRENNNAASVIDAEGELHEFIYHDMEITSNGVMFHLDNGKKLHISGMKKFNEKLFHSVPIDHIMEDPQTIYISTKRAQRLTDITYTMVNTTEEFLLRLKGLRQVIMPYLIDMMKKPKGYKNKKSQGGDFYQYRQYISGESARNIDWRVYARNDKLVIRETREEVLHIKKRHNLIVLAHDLIRETSLQNLYKLLSKAHSGEIHLNDLIFISPKGKIERSLSLKNINSNNFTEIWNVILDIAEDIIAHSEEIPDYNLQDYISYSSDKSLASMIDQSVINDELPSNKTVEYLRRRGAFVIGF